MTFVSKKQLVQLSKHPIWLECQRYWQLLSVLVPQNLNTRYRGSFLGVYWSLLNPIIMTALYTAIFGAQFASYYDDSIVNYMLAAFTGLLVINFYSSATSQALTSIVSNGDLLNKMKLPLPVFPLSMIAANIFQFVVGSLPLLVIITFIKSDFNIFPIFFLLIPFLSLVLVCIGIGLFLSALFVFFRDLGYFYEIVTFMMWITSPVFYPAEIVPEKVRPFLNLNPLVQIIESIRTISLQGSFPSFSYIINGFVSGIILVFLGWLFFRKVQADFMDLL